MGVMKAEGGNPAVTSSRRRTITATIAAIDPREPLRSSVFAEFDIPVDLVLEFLDRLR